MNYISAEEFLKQSEKVQSELLEWWEPQMLDLYFTDFGNNKKSYLSGIFTSCIQDNDTLSGVKRDKRDKPLLQMHQLIKFIEDKINKKIEIHHYSGGYEILDNDDLGNDLLQALWKVAIEIAEYQ